MQQWLFKSCGLLSCSQCPFVLVKVDIPGIPDCDCLDVNTVADASFKMADDIHPSSSVEFIPFDCFQDVFDIDLGCYGCD